MSGTYTAQQCQILNPLSQARDWTHNLMVPGRIHFHCTMTGIPKHLLFVGFLMLTTPPGVRWYHICGFDFHFFDVNDIERFVCLFVCLLIFFFFTMPQAYGSSGARDQTCATAATQAAVVTAARSLTCCATRELLKLNIFHVPIGHLYVFFFFLSFFLFYYSMNLLHL